MAHDVFVSYSSKDKAIADTIVAAMENNQIRCWYAPRDIQPSEDWGKAITNGILASRVFLIIFSGNANRSQRVLDELNFAVTKEITILPFRIENLEPDGAMGLHLSSRHWLNAYEPSWESHIRKLVKNVSVILETPIDDQQIVVPEGIEKKAKQQKKLSRILAGIAVVAILITAGWFVLPTITRRDDSKYLKFKVALLTDVPSSFIEGVKNLSDLGHEAMVMAEEDLGIKTTLLEAAKLSDLERNLTKAASEGYDLVVGIGFNFTKPMTIVAPEFPDTKFVIVDGVVEGPNVMSLDFAVEEGSFLVGVLAAGMSETGTIGFITALDIPEMEIYEAGYISGAMSINPDIKVVSGFTQSWFDVSACKELALGQYDQGADVIYTAAGSSSLGTIQAAEEKGFWAIGADIDQDSLSPGNVLTSMVIHVDTVVYDAVKAACEGTFEGGLKVYGLAEGGVGYSELKYTRDLIPEDLLIHLDEIESKYFYGEFTIPTTRDEAYSF
jgi:basic membrane protein A